jgi:hypothetical protein
MVSSFASHGPRLDNIFKRERFYFNIRTLSSGSHKKFRILVDPDPALNQQHCLKVL